MESSGEDGTAGAEEEEDEDKKTTTPKQNLKVFCDDKRTRHFTINILVCFKTKEY